MVDAGDHIVIAVEKDEVYDPSKILQYCRTYVDMSEVSKTELRACRSVLMLTPSAQTSQNWANFKDEVLARGKKQPFNIPEHPYIKIDVSINCERFRRKVNDALDEKTFVNDNVLLSICLLVLLSRIGSHLRWFRVRRRDTVCEGSNQSDG